jgi:hypothetical protein
MRFSIASLAAVLAAVAPVFAQNPPGGPVLAPPKDEMTVKVQNLSEPEVCAEKDNIDIRFSNPDVRRFKIQAIQPSYIGMLREDRYLPDWTACDMTGDPAYVSGKPRQVTLWETPSMWVVGHVFPAFWRPATVPVKIGDRVEHGLHLIQLWMRVNERSEEMLVVYPPDGYWRMRPLPPKHLGWTAYGSSFMVGPVTMEGRPVVALKEIAFDPEEKKFTFTFRDGGEGALRIVHLDADRFVIEATLAGDLPRDKPFAALRSGARRRTRAGGRSTSSITRAERRPSSGRVAMWPRATTPRRPTWCSPASRSEGGRLAPEKLAGGLAAEIGFLPVEWKFSRLFSNLRLCFCIYFTTP